MKRDHKGCSKPTQLKLAVVGPRYELKCPCDFIMFYQLTKIRVLISEKIYKLHFIRFVKCSSTYS